MFDDDDKYKYNPCFNTDGYNLGHEKLKKSVDWEVSHIYNRSEPIFVYGLNHQILKTFNVKVEEMMVEQAWEASANYIENGDKLFPIDMWRSVVKDFRGRMPVRVQALPDGTWAPARSVVCQVENTEEGFGELVTYMEGRLLKFAFPSGCLTRAYDIWSYIKQNDLNELRSHSFAFRGYDTDESAIWGGTAWAIFLKGSDDFHVLQYAPNSNIKTIIASAHKVEQQFDDEMEGYKFAVDAVAKVGNKIFSQMIDTYDAQRFINKYMIDLLEYANNRGIHVVLRPDSGDTLDQAIQIYKKAVEKEGYKNVSVIIGEGMSHAKVLENDIKLKLAGIPQSFVFYGIGGGYHVDIGRDHPSGASMKTAFSNGKARMKIVKGSPFKESIPNSINMVRDKNGQMTIDLTKDGLFEDVYYFNNRSDRQETFVQDWDDVNKRVWDQIAKGYDKQKKVLISPTLQQSINQIKAVYT